MPHMRQQTARLCSWLDKTWGQRHDARTVDFPAAFKFPSGTDEAAACMREYLSRIPESRDSSNLVFELLRRMPQIVGLLHPEPQTRAVAAELSDPDRHLRRHRRALGKDAMKRLSRHAEMPRRLRYRHLQRRQHRLRRTTPGWVGARFGRPAANSLLMESPSASMIVLQVDAKRLALDEFERDAYWPVHVHCEARRSKSLQRMKIVTGDIHVFSALRRIECVQSFHDPLVETGINFTGGSGAPKLTQPLVTERVDHACL